MTEIVRYAWGTSSLGPFIAASSDRGLVAFEFADPATSSAEALLSGLAGARLVPDGPALADTVERLAAVVDRPQQDAGLALDIRGSDHAMRVWAALRAIPAGRTTSYGEVAAGLGTPREAREVAEACAANRIAILIPCHRVVRKDGSLSGYRWGVRRKRELLAREEHAMAAARA